MPIWIRYWIILISIPAFIAGLRIILLHIFPPLIAELVVLGIIIPIAVISLVFKRKSHFHKKSFDTSKDAEKQLQNLSVNLAKTKKNRDELILFATILSFAGLVCAAGAVIGIIMIFDPGPMMPLAVRIIGGCVFFAGSLAALFLLMQLIYTCRLIRSEGNKKSNFTHQP